MPNESPCFPHYSPKVSTSNLLYFGSYNKKVSISSIPILIFLCIFIKAPSPVSHTYFCPWREIRSNHEAKMHKLYFRVKLRYIQNKNLVQNSLFTHRQYRSRGGGGRQVTPSILHILHFCKKITIHIIEKTNNETNTINYFSVKNCF